MSRRDCTEATITSGDPEEICRTGCTLFTCTILQGLEKNKPVSALVKMEFGPNTVGKTSNKFSITTALKINDTYQTSTNTTFQKIVVIVGGSEAKFELWPVIVGILVGVLIFASIMYVIYRKGLLTKLRFAKNKMDTDIRKSRIASYN